MAKDPNVVARRWAQRTGAATEAYTEGVRNPRRNPMEAAAAAKDKYLARVQEAAASGRYEAGLRRVSQAEWSEAAATKGAQRLGSGAAAAEGKMAGFMQEFLPHAERVSSQVQAMPSLTLEDRLARMVANARGNAQFRRS